MIFDLFVAVGFMIFFFFIKSLVFFSDVFDKLNDGFIVEVVDAIFDFVIVDEGIVVLQE